MIFRSSSLRHWALATVGAAAILSGAAAPPAAAREGDDFSTDTPIKHVVIIFQENITFDHYFATYPKAANPPGEPRFIAQDNTPAVNGLTDGLLTNNPNLFNPFRLDRSQAFTCDMDHGYTDEQKSVDGGLLDRFVQAVGRTGLGCNPNGSTVMGYYDGNTVTALWNYAQHFAMNDNSFGSNFGPSTVGALNLIAGQTHGIVQATVPVNGVPTPTTVSISGTTFVAAGDPQGTIIGDPQPLLDDCSSPKSRAQVRMAGPNVGDLLNAKHVTWGWFQGGFAPTVPASLNPDGTTKTPAVCGASHAGHPGVPNPTDGQTSPPTDIHGPVTDYVPHHSPFQYYQTTANPHHLPPSSVAMIGKTDQANHQYDLSAFFAALRSGHLPAVSYLKAAAFQDGHPGNSDPLSEQTFLVDVTNALQHSPEWRETAVIISYDDSDGWYDHVTGPILSPSATSVDALAGPGNCGTPKPGAFAARCGYGPRLPLLVVSPWAKANFIDHTTTDQSSILRFIEDNWELGFIDGPTAPPPGQASFDRIAGALNNMFDFDNPPAMRALILDPATGAVTDRD
jgi:phospholipase C